MREHRLASFAVMQKIGMGRPELLGHCIAGQGLHYIRAENTNPTEVPEDHV